MENIEQFEKEITVMRVLLDVDDVFLTSIEKIRVAVQEVVNHMKTYSIPLDPAGNILLEMQEMIKNYKNLRDEWTVK